MANARRGTYMRNTRPFYSYSKEQQESIREQMELYYKIQLLPAYNMVDVFTNELTAMLRQRGLLRHEVKKLATQLREPYRKVWNHLFTPDDKEFKEIFEDLCSQRLATLYPMVIAKDKNSVPRDGQPWPLNQAISASMFDAGVRGDMELYTMMEVTSAVIDLAKAVYDGFYKTYTVRFGFVFNPHLPGACSCDTESRMMEKLVERICPYTERHFIEDDRIRKSFVYITRQAMSLDAIDRDCDTSLSEDPERKARMIAERNQYHTTREYERAVKDGRVYNIVISSDIYLDIQVGNRSNLMLTDTQLRGMARCKADFLILRRGVNGGSMVWRIGRINKNGKVKLEERVVIEE